MIFGDICYAIFLLLTLCCYYLVPARSKSSIIAVFGLLFYAFYAGEFVILLAALTLGSWYALFALPVSGVPIVRPDSIQFNQEQPFKRLASPTSLRSPQFIAGSCIVMFVLVLAYFKYWGFLKSVFTGSPPVPWVAPLAISFFTFEFIHVAAERIKGNISKVPLIEYFAFIFFFPTLVAGPIKRYEQFDAQLRGAQLSSQNFLEGGFRILVGLLKKMVVADNLSTLISEVGSPAKTHNVLLLTGAIVLYGFQIYFDFSGYSDIAIGSARLFGIRVPENFLHPYRQSNISAFWRNWHVSLYSWLIDYVFIPLGGSRVVYGRVLLNILIVMLVSGIWHGAAWNYVLWGLWHGILLIIHRIYSDRVKPHLNPTWTQSRGLKLLSYGVTMSAVWFGWMLFMWPLPDIAQYLSLIGAKIT